MPVNFNGNELVSLSNLIKQVLSPSVTHFANGYDLNNFQSGVYRDNDLNLKNKPSDIDVWGVYVAINFKGWGIVQFAFPAQASSIYYRSVTNQITKWNKISGGVLASLLNHIKRMTSRVTSQSLEVA